MQPGDHTPNYTSLTDVTEQFGSVGLLIVDRISVLHPAMRGKWRFLDADDCLHGQTVFLTHGSERKGSLQAFVMAAEQ